MPQGYLRTWGEGQDQLGITQIEQATFSLFFQNILGQRQMAPPCGNGSLQLAVLDPGQVAHRYAGKGSQALHHLRMRGNTATKLGPGIGIGAGIAGFPASFSTKSQQIKHLHPVPHL